MFVPVRTVSLCDIYVTVLVPLCENFCCTCFSNVGYSVLYGNLPSLFLCDCIFVWHLIYVTVLSFHLKQPQKPLLVTALCGWLTKIAWHSHVPCRSIVPNFLISHSFPTFERFCASATEALTIRKPNMTQVYIQSNAIIYRLIDK